LTLLLFPFQAELQGFLGGEGGLQEKVISGFKTFTIDAHPNWTLAICSQGKVEAALTTAILGEALRPSRVFLIGSATALVSNLYPGDIVAGMESLEIDFGDVGVGKMPRHKATWEQPSRLGQKIISGRILSADADVFDPGEKKRLGEEYQAQACAWEGAGFYRALKKIGLRGLELRVITESVSESRIAFPELKSRIQAHFPRLRREMEAWEADLSNIG